MTKTKSEIFTPEQILDKQIALQIADGTLALVYHRGTDKPYSFREYVKIINNSNSTNKPKPYKQGHRKPLFTKQQEKEIMYKFTYNKTSKNALAKEYHCSEKTIRNIIKKQGALPL